MESEDEVVLTTRDRNKLKERVLNLIEGKKVGRERFQDMADLIDDPKAQAYFPATTKVFELSMTCLLDYVEPEKVRQVEGEVEDISRGELLERMAEPTALGPRALWARARAKRVNLDGIESDEYRDATAILDAALNAAIEMDAAADPTWDG